ncbi:non-ribosomal peptide synthetase [Chitinophaga sp. LS1]|uniref:non-ribosomal peptide synthetase n=1 Tax=Chitinophaga sp. LS1 TaxID=3051176 RepID=UPI002AAB5919|nr:non-ribosomal peptide synthetase [Chitinophaga sp. LS1]WPV65668.1 amino acid adenylation domain-containing protein [Chitinophaga sp. LS1]
MIELINRLSEEKISLSVDGEDLRLVFENESGTLPEDLLQVIKANKQELIRYLNKYTKEGQVAPIRPVAVSKNYPLSEGQRRLWILSQFPEAAMAYTMPVRITLEPHYIPGNLEKALLSVIDRHEILRTVFRENEEGEIRQVVLSAGEFPFSFQQQDASEWDESAVKKYLEEEAALPFDLWAGPLLRAGLLRLKDGRFLFHYNMHHIISDGWSMEVLQKDILGYYHAFTSGTPYHSLPLKIQYKDYASWQQEQLATEAYVTAGKYWLEQFSGELPVLELPVSGIRPPVLTHRGKTMSILVNKPVTDALKNLCREEDTTLFMGLLAVLNTLFYRYTGQEDMIIGTPLAGREHPELEDQIGYYLNTLALRTRFSGEQSFLRLLEQVRLVTLDSYKYQAYPFDKLVDELEMKRDLSRSVLFDVMVILQSHRSYDDKQAVTSRVPGVVVEEGSCMTKLDLNFDFAETAAGLSLRVEFNTDIYEGAFIRQLVLHFVNLLQVVVSNPATALCKLDYLPSDDREQLLKLFNQTAAENPADKTVIDLFREQVEKDRNKKILTVAGASWTYGELDAYSDHLAHYLVKEGITPGTPVPVFMNRCAELLIAILGVMKAGAVYVPLDPEYPADRIAYMLSDTGAQLVLSTELVRDRLVDVQGMNVVSVDKLTYDHAHTSGYAPLPAQVAYIIYTSGSTGRPKGVMIAHGALLNFMYGMKELLSVNENDHLLAITSVSFDISILELIWTLCNGVRITLHDNSKWINNFNTYAGSGQVEMDFSLFYFASQQEEEKHDKYQFLLQSVQFADAHKFSGVWLPERHFHAFGGIFPNPAVLAGALSAITNHVKLRSGSVVLPLHDEIRVAEDWAVVDNLSAGRVELSFASGWHADDFVLKPENYSHRQEIMYRQLQTLQTLWKGGSITRKNGNDREKSLRVFPRPIQQELPIWITSAGSTDTFRTAGSIGAHLLTHMLGQDITVLAKNIHVYKQALIEHGYDPATRKVAVMLHTFIGQDDEKVRATVKQPFKEYLRSNVSLLKNLAGNDAQLAEADMEAVLEAAFERYWQSAALLGTPATCHELIARLYTIGVTEIACLVDFGIDTGEVMESLPLLNELKQQYARKTVKDQQAITAMQITPSYLNSLLEDNDSRLFVKSLHHLIVGGEKFPEKLFRQVQSHTSAAIYNVYGPTETTIWSTGALLRASEHVHAGKPIRNTAIYILDKYLQLCPAGVYGDVYIGGDGLANGYFNNEELTAQVFVKNPFAHGERMYKTGDIGRWNMNARIEIAGRNDQQVKIRGYRIEPGEIENIFQQSGYVAQVVVQAREQEDGSRLLVAIVIPETGFDKEQLKGFLKSKLPDYMIPAHIIEQVSFPLTPNGKIDRKKLSQLDISAYLEVSDGFVAATEELERIIECIWQQVLHIKKNISVHTDFFNIGGHSLRLMQLVNHYYRHFEVKLTLQELFQHTTIAAHAGLIRANNISLYSAIPVLADAPDYPVSDGQRRIWITCQQEDTARSYYNPGRIILDDRYETPVVEKAIALLIERHEVLRTVFRQNAKGELRQVVLPAGQSLYVPDMVVMTVGGDEAVNDYINGLSDQPFDLENGPLFRWGMVNTGHQHHILWFNLHHIISDGWSLEVLYREVLHACEAILNGASPALPPLRIQYKEYASWQQEQLKSTAAQVHRNYWVKQFEGDITPLQLPAKYPRPKVMTQHGRYVAAIVSPAVTDRLLQLCNQYNSTLYMGMLSVLYTLLYRYSGQDDILIGSPVAGRDHVDLENQIGFYINTLVMRTQLQGEMDFISLLQKVRETALAAYEHQSYPFDRLVEELHLSRDTSRSPLFDIMFTMQNQQHNENDAYEDRTATIIARGNTSVKYDMLFNVEQYGGSLRIDLKYNADIYGDEQMEQLLSHYLRLLDQQCSWPEQSLDAVDILYPAETWQLSADWNVHHLEYDRSRTVLAMFHEQVKRVPEQVAVVCGDAAITYAELDSKSNRIANFLLRAGIGQEERVVISAAKSVELVMGIVGILKAGGVFVPVDPSFPPERIRYIIEDTGARMVIAEEAMQQAIGPISGLTFLQPGADLVAGFDVPPVASADAAPVVATDVVPTVVVLPEQLAYIIYTSGSTGRPKGVMISHYSLTAHLLDIIPRTGLDTCKSFGILASLAADAYHTIHFASLCTGGSLHLLPEELLHNGQLLQQYFEAHTIEAMKIFPSLWTSYASLGYRILPAKVLIFGGEKFPGSVLQHLTAASYRGKVFNHYGPTESTIGVLLHEVNLQHVYEEVPVGRPYGNARVYVVNGSMQLCPVGVAGELLIGGDGVARGYLNQPALTAERFMADPITGAGRVYRTGDLVRWSASGDIIYVGRTDDQVKVRGYRIEPGEIEKVLLSVEGVGAAVVMLQEDANDDKLLVAFYTGKQYGDLWLREQAGKQLPEYMLPGRFIHLESLPLLPNGKIDRKSLPDVDRVELAPATVYTAPASGVETAVLECCQEVLKRPLAGGITDSFFESGGDSIKAILLATKLKQRGYSVKVGDILKYPVLKVLSGYVTEVVQKQVKQEVAVEGNVQLTPVQAAFVERNYKDKHHYNQSILLKSRERIDTGILEKCLQTICTHHDALRMICWEEEGIWRQFNRSKTAKSYKLEVHDLQGTTSQLSAIADRLQATIDLADGPLLHAGLFHMEDGDRLLLVVHHLVVDGISWRILLEDLALCYGQLVNGQQAELPLKTDSFMQWSASLQQLAATDQLAAEIPYWQQVVSARRVPLPVDFPEGRVTDTITRAGGFVLDKTLTASLLTEVNKVYNTDTRDLLLTALGMSVKESFGCQNLMILQEGHGREDVLSSLNVSRTVGWFTAIYPFLLDTSDTGDPQQYLVSVKEALRAIPRKGAGYGVLRYLRNEVHPILPADITFNYMGEFSELSDNPGTSSLFSYAPDYKGMEVSETYTPETGITITGMIAAGNLSIAVRYIAAWFREETITAWLENYKRQLEQLIRRLSATAHQYVTPSDLTFSGMSIDELQALNPTGNIEDIYELSPLQEGIYYHWLSDPATTSYVNQVSYHVKGKLSTDILRQSFEYLVARHEVTRTAFTHLYSGVNLQIVQKSVTGGFRYEVVTDLLDVVAARKEADIRQGFDLGNGSQVRLTVLDGGNNEYVFIWTYHHILMDGWCSGVLIREFYAVYQAYHEGRQPSLEKVYPYSDYISWLSKLDIAASRQYWRHYLQGYAQTVRVPFRNITLKNGPGAMSKFRFELDSTTVQAIRNICRKVGVTENTFMQACWAWLLGRYNNSEDVVFGAVVSGRPHEVEGVDKMVGLFINTIPVRITCQQDLTVTALLRSIQDDAIQSLPHHYLRLPDVQSESPLRNELFDHVFVYENFPIQEMIAGNAAVSSGGLDELSLTASEASVESSFDFTVQVVPVREHMRITFMYRSEIYEQAAVQKIAGHFNDVINAFATGTSPVNYLSYAELCELYAFGRSVAEVPVGTTFMSLFEGVVKSHPEAAAIHYGGERWSYQRLDETGNRIAEYLITQGVVNGSKVLLCMPSSGYAIASLLGILKSGGCYVPVDPAYPVSRIRHILSDCQTDLLITDRVVADSLPADIGRILIADELEGGGVAPSVSITGSDLLYVIYTSGSTGQPKGVQITQGNIVDYLYGLASRIPISSCRDYALVSGLFTDLGNTVVYSSLAFGGCLHLFSKEELSSPDVLIQSIKEIDCVKITPSHWKALSAGRELLLPKRLLVFGGEALPASIPAQIRGCEVVNHYGPTETTVGKLLHVCTPNESEGIVPVGRPFGNTQVYILDSNGQPCGIGIPGELYIGGDGVSIGYVHNAPQTASRFVKNGLHAWPAVLYKTGDQASYLPDGSIRFLGRQDHQVKIRGYRVELEEILSVLNGCAGVLQSAVLVKATESGENELGCFISGTATVAEVERYLSLMLPGYMVPTHIEHLAALPLTGNGKIDRQQLLDSWGAAGPGSNYVAPRNDMEARLATLWQEVLGVSQPIGVHDSFFDLGGHSIKVIKLLSRISKEFGVTLSIQTIFKEATIEGLARGIEESKWMTAGAQTSHDDREYEAVEI